MDKGRYHKNQTTGKLVRNDINEPCPNSRCHKKRLNHTGIEAKNCFTIAMTDAGNNIR